MPIVTEIRVSAGRTFNHPHESYSNLKPTVSVVATLQDGEDWQEATKSLQATAERLVEDHKQHMLQSLEELAEMERRGREAANIERTIRDAQTRLDALRSGAKMLPPIEDDDHPF